MSSLEFIEKEIQKAKELLQRLEKLKVISNKYELQLNEVLEKDTQEKLFYLQQIKSILEAWEELKPEIKEHKEVLYEDELTNVLVFALPYSANPKKYNAIKKALEAKNENSRKN